jgi:DNA-binding LacI/PurR family transcriptional regulator
MTVVKAMRQLQQEGLLTRRSGSGSYAAESATGQKPVFGLIIPDLGETEIFEPICKGMAASPLDSGHSLSWGWAAPGETDKESAAVRLCERYIEQKVTGVFFAPVEFSPNRDEINRQVLRELTAAGIPVVLLDRCVLEFPQRSEFDLVGIDNRRAGYIVAEHLIRKGARRIGFLAVEGSAETVEDRITGYREALIRHKISHDLAMVLRHSPEDGPALERAIRKGKIDALMCANDLTAAKAMRSLLQLGIRIPDELRVTGIDDVRYAELLPVPLTTYRQPCLDIGTAAIAAMLDRIRNPKLPPRSILLNGQLVVRQSCG